MDEEREIHWSDQLENLVAAEAERCRGYAWINQRCETIYTRKNNMIAIPVIILSTLSGATSMSSATLFNGETRISSIVIGLVGITVGILQTLNSFFQYAQKSTSHRVAYLHYSKLFNTTAIELSLPRNERLPCDQVLSNLRTSMERLAETTYSPPAYVLEEFNKRFKDEDKGIARPIESNGLFKVYIERPLSLKNIKVKVENEPTDTGKASQQERSQERRSRVIIGGDESAVHDEYGKETSSPSGKESPLKRINGLSQ